ncbi:hypothetical protein C2U56_00555 [Pseudomonas fluorescens]|nr:hypothetical protein C2U56_00555 [Pseudomonas fluorescens]
MERCAIIGIKPENDFRGTHMTQLKIECFTFTSPYGIHFLPIQRNNLLQIEILTFSYTIAYNLDNKPLNFYLCAFYFIFCAVYVSHCVCLIFSNPCDSMKRTLMILKTLSNNQNQEKTGFYSVGKY